MYTWTAIHSGWSNVEIRVFQAATFAVPLAIGIAVGWIAYRAAESIDMPTKRRGKSN
jgi:hypothetical protein